MAEQLKNTLSFNLAPGASVVLPHGLKIDGRALAPDVIFIPSADLDVSASTNASITLFNSGSIAIAGDVLVEAWHTIERVFGDVANTDLPVKPYIVVSAADGNAQSWPAFQDTTGVGVPRRIYANATGDDLTGNGTQALPYRTFQHAVRDLPRQIVPGERVILDITNLGTGLLAESLPPDYALPQINCPFGLDFASAFPGTNAPNVSNFPFQIGTALEIIATPKLATGIPQLIDANLVGGMFPGIPGVYMDPSTNLIEIHVTAGLYPANSLRGKFLQSVFGTCGVIWRNADVGGVHVIYTSRASLFEEFLSPMFSSPASGLIPAPPFTIREPSAEFILNNNPADLIKPGFAIGGSGSMGLRGIKFTPAVPNPTGFSVQTYGSRTIFFENCDFFSFGTFHGAGCNIFLSCNMQGGSFASQSPICWISSTFLDMAAINPGWSTPGVFLGLGFAIDNCPALGVRLDALTPAGRGPMFDLQLRGGVIHGSVPDTNYAQIADPANFPAPFMFGTLSPNLMTPGHGIILRGGKGYFDHVKIFGCAGDAIHAEAGFGLIEMKSVTGGETAVPTVYGLVNTNAGSGYFATDGTKALVVDQAPIQANGGALLDFVADTPSPGLTTLNDPAGYFRQSMVGGPIVIAGANAGNNGTHTVVSVSPIPNYGMPGGTSIVYVNAGFSETGVAGATWSVPNLIPTTVAGLTNEISVGDLAPVTWVAFRAGGKLLYDITAVGVPPFGGATGTGTRLEEKP